jgi:hypothetical protein
MKRFLYLLMFLLFIPMVESQEGSCVPTLSFRYDAASDVFSLVNANGETVRSYPEIRRYEEQYDRLEHSPDCRFIVATIWRDYSGRARQDLSIAGDTTVWNAATGEQLQVFEDAHESPHSII